MPGSERSMLSVSQMQSHSRSSPQPKPSMRSLAAGQLLCQFGDPPGPLYIILSGKLRVYRPNLNRPNETIELAQLGPGAVVGEVAPILGQQRSASVRAIEASTLLAVPVDQLGTLTRLQAPLARVIVQALHERAGLSAAEISVLVGNLGIELPDLVGLLTSEDDRVHSADVAGSPHGADALYSKTVTCPTCDTAFSTQVVRLNKDRPVHQESDFHQIYEPGFNPYDYEPWVCPSDLFAALPADFRPVTEEHRERVPAALAAVQHRLAWCARERKNTLAEQLWLTEALESYSAAHEQGAGASVKEELRIGYLCGELALRLGDQSGACTWFGQALLHPALKSHPMWQRLLHGQLDVARASVR